MGPELAPKTEEKKPKKKKAKPALGWTAQKDGDGGGTSAYNNDAQGGGGHQHARAAAARAREAARPREEWQQTPHTGKNTRDAHSVTGVLSHGHGRSHAHRR